MRFPRKLVLASLLLISCSTIPVFDSYPNFLEEHSGTVYSDKLNFKMNWEMTKRSNKYLKEVSSGTAGVSKTWLMDFGKMMRATLESNDVKRNFVSLVEGAKNQNDVHAIIDVIDFGFASHHSIIKLRIDVSRGDKPIFSNTYEEVGDSKGADMFLYGPTKMGTGMQESTKSAMDKILKVFLRDLKVLSPPL